MAFNTANYHSNSIVGIPQVGSDINIYDVHTSPKYAIGFGFTRADGNKYRYCHFGIMTSQSGLVMANDYSGEGAPASGVTVTAVDPGSTTAQGGEAVKANAKGSRYVQLTVTASAQQFAGGYLVITSGTGYGFTYRVKGNTVSGTPAATSSTFEIDAPLQAALSGTATAATVCGSPYMDLKKCDTTDFDPSGVSCACVSADGYGWIQTHGVCGVLTGAYVPVKGPVVASTNTAGGIEIIQFQTTTALGCAPIIGNVILPSVVANYSTVYLTIE